MLLIRERQTLNPNEDWVKASNAVFKPGLVTPMPRPVGSFFVCTKHKLLYAPIAKCGCTSIKHLMVELSELEHSQVIVSEGVHRVTDGYITGAQVKDYDADTVAEILNSEDYYRFAVLREPVKRLISAYTEKFLLNRHNAGNLVHTLDLIREVRCQSKPNLDQGITFREFVEHIVNADPATLDPHWAPQHLYIRGVDRYDEIFTMEQMAALESRLSERTGKSITMSQHNSSVSKSSNKLPDDAGRYADLLPEALDKMDTISSADFMAPDLVSALESYYAEDVNLYREASTNERYAYSPPPLPDISYREEALEVPLTSAPEIARFTSLYTKGFFALDTQGSGELPVMIANTSPYILDFDKLPSCSLLFKVMDANGNLLQAVQAQLVQPGLLAPHATATALLRITVQPELVTSVKTATFALKFGEDFLVEDVSPLHMAAAQRAIAN